MAERVQGGYRFTEEDGSLTIRSHAAEPWWQKLVAAGLFAVCFAVGANYVAVMVREVRAHGLVEGGATGAMGYAKALLALLVVLGVVVGVVLAWARPVFGGHEELRLNAREMTLVNVDFGVRWRRRVFAAGEVRAVAYVETGKAEVGAEYAIEFRGRGRRVVMFLNIEQATAHEVMSAMADYGFGG